MKRCPKCNRTYTTDTQKFCTHDGGVLETPEMHLETVRIDTAQLDDDAPTKEIAPSPSVEFDPFKTVMSRPEGTVTQGIGSPAPNSQSAAPPLSPPPPPPQSSPSAPTIALTGSGPIPASAPLPPPQVAQPPPPPPPPPAAPQLKKRSKLPLVLGILLVLFIVGGVVLGVGYYFVLGPMLARRGGVIDNPRPPTRTPTPNVGVTPNEIPSPEKKATPELPPYSPPADAVEFVNAKENLDGKLAEHYVDFSFYYPESWQKDPTTGVPGARNYVQFERRLPPNFTQESLAVSWSSSAAPVAENLGIFRTMTENLSEQFKNKFPGYRKVSEGETKAGVYDGYEFRFEATSKDTVKGDLKLWGRVIFLPPQDGGKDGVTLLMLATSLATELKSVNDVGVKGELPMMLQSFRLGKK